MLKNKFGMLKVLALALTVLMLASLVACDKGMDDAAIQDAINAAVALGRKVQSDSTVSIICSDHAIPVHNSICSCTVDPCAPVLICSHGNGDQKHQGNENNP